MPRSPLSCCALLVIDLQRYFLSKGAPAYLDPPARLLPHVLQLIEAFRQAELPVAYTRHAHCRGSDTGQMGRWWRGHLPWEGTRYALLAPELAPERGELVIAKTRYSAFEGTRLGAWIARKGVDTVVLCGVMTNLCVETTARHAFMKDLNVIVVKDACAAGDLRRHRAALLNLAYGFARIATTATIVNEMSLRGGKADEAIPRKQRSTGDCFAPAGRSQ